MATVGKQLGQLRPADTTAASLYSLTSGVTRLTQLTIVNTSTTATVRVRLFHDDNGTTYDETTTLMWDRALAPNSEITLGLGVYMNDASGNFAVRTDTANIATFTLYGLEQT